jgi:hypothetical protein
MGPGRFEILLSAFQTHVKHGGDRYVSQFLENPVGGEIDIHFGANINSIRQGYRQIRANKDNTQEPHLTAQIIKRFTDAGMLWDSPKMDSRGRSEGHKNSIPRGNLGRKIYTAAILEYVKQNPNQFPLELKRSRKSSRNVAGTTTTINFEGVIYEAHLGNLAHNLKTKTRRGKISLEEHTHWSSLGIDLPDFVVE